MHSSVSLGFGTCSILNSAPAVPLVANLVCFIDLREKGGINFYQCSINQCGFFAGHGKLLSRMPEQTQWVSYLDFILIEKQHISVTCGPAVYFWNRVPSFCAREKQGHECDSKACGWGEEWFSGSQAHVILAAKSRQIHAVWKIMFLRNDFTGWKWMFGKLVCGHWGCGQQANLLQPAKMNFSLLVFVASQVGAVLKEAYYTAAVC